MVWQSAGSSSILSHRNHIAPGESNVGSAAISESGRSDLLPSLWKHWVGLVALLTLVIALPVCAQTTCVATEPDKHLKWILKNVQYSLSKEKPAEALALITAEIGRSSKSVEQTSALMTALGEIRYQLRDEVAAITAFNNALQLDPCNGRAHYFAWRIDSITNRPEQAAIQINMAHRLAPFDSQIEHSWMAVQQASALAEDPGFPHVIASPRESPFPRTLVCDGIPVRSSAKVNPQALILACGKIQRMLAGLPEARRRLVSGGAELHVIGEFENTSDLPEARRFKGNSSYIDAEGRKTNIDERTRGVGGLMSSCGEENLLALPSDRYFEGEDTCTHEFAHDLRNHGLKHHAIEAINRRYKDAMSAGLWKGGYASVNADEFFAELSCWYFGGHGGYLANHIPPAGAESLKLYDPDSFAVLEKIYTAHD